MSIITTFLRAVFALATLVTLSNCSCSNNPSADTSNQNNSFKVLTVLARTTDTICEAHTIDNQGKTHYYTSSKSDSNNGYYAVFNKKTPATNFIITCNNGSYTDEATNQSATLTSTITAVVAPNKAIYIVSPLTELAYRRGGGKQANLASINKIVEVYNQEVAKQYGVGHSTDTVDVTVTEPTNITQNIKLNADIKEDKYAIILAAISQMSKDTQGVNNGTSTLSVIDVLDSNNQTNGGTNTAGIKDLLTKSLASLATNTAFINSSTATITTITTIKTIKTTIANKVIITATAITVSSPTSDTTTLKLAGSFTIVASATTSVTTTAVTDSSVSYQSDNTSVVTVDTNGVVRVIGAGTAIVTILSNDNRDIKATKTFTIAYLTQEDIKLASSSATTTFVDGSTLTALAVIGSTRTDNFTYTSGNTSVATVDTNTGVVSIVGAGTTTITVTKDGTGNYADISTSYDLNIDKSPQATLTVASPTITTAIFKENATITAPVTSGGSGDGTLTYTSGNTSVATIDTNTGVVNIIGAGSTTITINKDSNSNYKSTTTTYTLTIDKGQQATLIVVSPTVTTATFGVSTTITAPVTSGGSGDGTLTYTSGNTSVATIDTNTGVVNIVGAGSTTITINKDSDSNYKSTTTTYTLTIDKGQQATLIVVSPTVTTATFGVSTTITAPVTSGGSGDGTLTYTSDNTSVATIDTNTGVVNIIGAGSTTITINKDSDSNYKSTTATYTLTIDKANSTITITSIVVGFTPNMKGNTQTATITTTPTSLINIGTISYTTAGTATTVDTITGIITLNGLGVSTITATLIADNYNIATTTYTITLVKVVPPATPTVFIKTTASTTPIITGTAIVDTGGTLTIAIGSATYTGSAVSVDNNVWSIDTSISPSTGTFTSQVVIDFEVMGISIGTITGTTTLPNDYKLGDKFWLKVIDNGKVIGVQVQIIEAMGGDLSIKALDAQLATSTDLNINFDDTSTGTVQTITILPTGLGYGITQVSINGSTPTGSISEAGIELPITSNEFRQIDVIAINSNIFGKSTIDITKNEISIISNTIPQVVSVTQTQTLALGTTITSTITTAISIGSTGGNIIECSSNPPLPAGVTVELNTDTMACEVTGIPENSQTTQTYTISAANNQGTATATISIAVETPAPINLSALALDRTIALKWDEVLGNAVTYKVSYSIGTTLTGAIVNKTSLVTNITITNLTNDMTYTFVVTAIQSSINSKHSSPISIAPETLGALNDTGITVAGNSNSNNASSCSGSDITTAPQDCHHGRDTNKTSYPTEDIEVKVNGSKKYITEKAGSGSAGFDFTRLNANGTINNSTHKSEYAYNPWECVKDNHTGLTWVIRKFSTPEARPYMINQLSSILNNFSACTLSTDWRIPTTEELISIIDYSKSNPAMDENYFADSENDRELWTSQTSGTGSDNYVLVNVRNGSSVMKNNFFYSVRFVHD